VYFQQVSDAVKESGEVGVVDRRIVLMEEE